MEKKPESAARREIEIELKGKTYTVRELDLAAYGEAENWVKSEHIRLYRENSVGVDPDKVEETVSKMIKSSYTPEELGAAVAAPSAAEFVAYLSLRHNPGITRETIGDIVDLDNIGFLNIVIQSLQEDEIPVDPPPENQENL